MSDVIIRFNEPTRELTSFQQFKHLHGPQGDRMANTLFQSGVLHPGYYNWLVDLFIINTKYGQ